jgi:hypothetical protein
MAKIITVKIADIKDGFYVREKMDDDRVLFLASLIDAGVELSPIKLTPNLEIIYGRHRREAHKFLDRETIKAEILEGKDDVLTLINLSLEENLGGALPPTKEDIIHTIKHLINKSYSQQQILNSLQNHLPRSMLRVLYQRASSDIVKKKTAAAIDLMSKGATIKYAAETEKVSVEAIQKELKHRSNKNGNGTHNLRAIFQNRFNHFNRSNGQLVMQLFQEYQTGDRTKNDTNDTMKLLGKLIGNQNRLWMDWESRFNKITQ